MQDYWKFVHSDLRNWNEDQKILFWWVVFMLNKMTKRGVIAMPDPAPLTASQIEDVFAAIIPESGTTRAFMDFVWEYDDQVIFIESSDKKLIKIEKGIVSNEKI